MRNSRGEGYGKPRERIIGDVEGGCVSVVTASSGAGAGEHTGTDEAGLTRGWGISTQRQQAITGTLLDLVPRSGRLSPAMLRDVTLKIVGRSELWADPIVHDPDVRWYLPLARWDTCDVWLLAWERGRTRTGPTCSTRPDTPRRR
jgi:hypothetical protein